MAICTHQQWLRLRQEKHSLVLQYDHRLDHITRSLPRPERQFPSLIFFVGKLYKGKAIRALFPGNTISRCRNHDIANICLDSSSLASDHPILLADSTPDHSLRDTRGKLACHETINFQIPWSDKEDIPASEDLVGCIHSRVFALFINVLCLFAQDFGGLDAVAKSLTTWTTRGSPSRLPISIRPRLVVVMSISGPDFDSEALRFRLQVLSDPNFTTCFSSVQVVNVLGSPRTPDREQFGGLGMVLQREVDAARAERSNTHTLFSMVHITAFFDMALKSFATSPHQAFDFLGFARGSNTVSATFQQHLKSFLAVSSRQKLRHNLLWEFIASAIVLESFPPDMHLFNPAEVFRTFYREACLLGIQDFAESLHLCSQLICADIEGRMLSMFSMIKSGRQSAAVVRQQSLDRSSQYWKLLKSHVDCFVCLHRKPEHIMDCGHGLCDTCVSNPNFSKSTAGREYHYDIKACPQCRSEVHFQARVLPPTCRVRFLGIDGGGSRGVVSLAFMEELQRALDLPYPVQEHFDFAIGTSSGGIATIGLFGKYWTPQNCLHFFRRFARKIFPRRLGTKYSVCAILRRIFSFYREDGKYDAVLLEEALQEALGLDPIFKSVKSRPSGMRFAVTATTILDATLCLITNYNGEGNVCKDPRYKHLRAAQPSEEIALWEAARCTTAAPTYFKPKYLQPFGTFQDGGLKYNNPVRPGLREVGRIWKDGDCDLVLSIGTGFEQKLLSPVAANVRNFFQDGALARLYRASMDSLSLNGQLSWEDHWYGLREETKRQQFRLNLPLIGKEPNIDDVDKIQYLCEQIPYHLGDMEGIARAFKAVSFFFELDGLPALDCGMYKCYGSILCRSPDSRALVRNLGNSHPYAQFRINDVSTGLLSASDICQLCGRFSKPIAFYVRHPSDQVNLVLAFNRLFHRSVSAFPQSIEWFVERQNLNAKFGQANHQSRFEQSENPSCDCILQRRRELLPPTPGRKKRSLKSRTVTHNKRRRL